MYLVDNGSTGESVRESVRERERDTKEENEKEKEEREIAKNTESAPSPPSAP